MLLGLELVSRPGQRGVGAQRVLLGQKIRVLSARPVHGGEATHHEVPHVGGRRGCQQVQRADRLQLVGVLAVALRVGEEREMENRLDLLFAQQLEQGLVRRGLSEIDAVLPHAGERSGERGDVDRDEVVRVTGLEQSLQDSRAQKRRGSRDRDAHVFLRLALPERFFFG